MASERTRVIDWAIIGLLALNIALTAYATFGSRITAEQSVLVEQTAAVVSDDEALRLASEIAALYNAKNVDDLYDRFDSLAKAQFAKEKLANQLEQLHSLMGTISDPAFSSAVVAGNDNGREYLNLLYKVRLSGDTFSSGDLRLTVTRRDGGLGLIGFHIGGEAVTQ